jgi:hypothetical protein
VFEQQAAQLELDETGLDAVFALADAQGYGFVAFEDPQAYDFSGLELQDDAPEIGDQARYAVLSVGDLAFPNHLTINPEPSEVVRMPGIELLQALFEQDRLHPDRELLSHHPTVEELHLQAQLDPGLFTVKRIETLESTASNLAVDIERMINTGDARPLGVPLESGGPIALPDGGVLSVMQGVEIVSPDAFVLDYELAPELRLEYTPPTALLEGPDHRRPCASLAGGALAVDEFPEVVAGADGRALLVHTASKGLEVWMWIEGEGCSFARQGRLPSPEEGEKGLGVPSSEGVVARVGVEGKASRIRLYESRPNGEEPTRVELASLAETALGKPVWLDARYLVAGGRTKGEVEGQVEEAVFVFDTQEPDRVLRLDARTFGPDIRLRHMAALPGVQPGFLVTTRGRPDQLYRVSFGDGLEGQFQREPGATPEENEVGEQTALAPTPEPVSKPSPVLLLTAEDVQIQLLHEGGRISHPVVSPDARWVSFSRGEEDAVVDEADIAALRLDPPATELIMLSKGPVADQKPLFTPDGRFVVFETRVSVNFAGHELVAPRVAALPE